MPELPEVETTRRGIVKPLKQQTFTQVIIRQPQLRWPIPANLPELLIGSQLLDIKRRAKYLLLATKPGTLIIHLGMSGHLRILSPDTPLKKHDHVDFIFNDELCLRYNDPRRFGAILWTEHAIFEHPLLNKLGPEPLDPNFNAEYLHAICQNKKIPIKVVLMDAHVVVGVGNIYANEALFLASILPSACANQLTHNNCEKLVTAVKLVLEKAIKAGGTTLKDFMGTTGKPGYFRHALQVYNREHQACFRCKHLIQKSIIAQRSTYFCTYCQSA